MKDPTTGTKRATKQQVFDQWVALHPRKGALRDPFLPPPTMKRHKR